MFFSNAGILIYLAVVLHAKTEQNCFFLIVAFDPRAACLDACITCCWQFVLIRKKEITVAVLQDNRVKDYPESRVGGADRGGCVLWA